MRKAHTRSYSCDFKQKALEKNERSASQINLPHVGSPGISHHSDMQGSSSSLEPQPAPRFMDDGGLSITHAADGYFPRPQEGQSLVQYLKGISQSSRKCADLDRENAHFNISEVMISVIEQVKFGHVSGPSPRSSPCSKSPCSKSSSRSHSRNCSSPGLQKQQDSIRLAPEFSSVASSYYDGAGTSTSSPSNYESSSGAFSDSSITLCQGGSLSLISLDTIGSETEDFSRFNQSGTIAGDHVTEEKLDYSNLTGSENDSFVAAEDVALALIRTFSDDFLPNASDLDWVVNEMDAPQGLLPLPEVISNSDLESEDDKITDLILRGSKEWAPPRPQIVFTLHPMPNAKVQVAIQNYRCAGCGLKVDRCYVRRFRFCEYLGKFFCTGCHGNKSSIIPARVLRKWDFRRYPTSNFASTLLERMWYDPLFNIMDLNPGLYRRSRELEKVTFLRTELQPVAEYIKSCRYCDELNSRLSTEFSSLESEPHTYSLYDLARIHSGDLPPNLKSFISECSSHVLECPLCRARGFLCETCGSDDVIFPFLPDIERCTKCGACAHAKCFMREKCPRCARLEIRRLQRARKSESY